jgi:hypothetical protein|nr:MAG TPA: hypothetical protein [Caudoviricetes sp.]
MKNVIEIDDGEFLEALKDYIQEGESTIKEMSSAIIAGGSDQNLGAFFIELLENINLLKDMTYRRPVQIHIKTFEYILLDIDSLIMTIDQNAGIHAIHDFTSRLHRSTITFRNHCLIVSEN